MTSRFATVEEYMAALPDELRPILERLRATIRAVVPNAGETISYSMPTFTLDGRPLLHMAAWRNHIGLYPLPELDGELARDVGPYRGTKDTMRLPLRRPVPYELVERVVAALVRERRAGS